MKTKIALVFVLSSIPLARSAPVEGAAIQSWYYDAPNSQVVLRILNTTDKPITAYDLTLTVTDITGLHQAGLTRDFLNTQVFLEHYKGTVNEEPLRQRVGPQSIPPGGSYDEKIHVGSDFKDFSATLELVAFADRTASATSPRALQRLIDQRKATIAAIDDATQKINASAYRSEAETAVSKFRDAWSDAPQTGHQMDTAELAIIADELKQIPDTELANYVAAKQRERAIWADQADLKLQGGAQ